jgi:hypothetical protein
MGFVAIAEAGSEIADEHSLGGSSHYCALDSDINPPPQKIVEHM